MSVAVAGAGTLALPGIAVEAITVTDDRTVVRDVSVRAEPGRLLAVTGRSGAGKTTLLWSMAGLIRPWAGAVLLDGVAVRDRDHAVSRRVVLVPRGNGLAPILTAAESIQVALIACGGGGHLRRRGEPAGRNC